MEFNNRRQNNSFRRGFDRDRQQFLVRNNYKPYERNQSMREYGGYQNRIPRNRNHHYQNRATKNYRRVHVSDDMNPNIYKSPQELKIDKIISAVQSQGILGKIILLIADGDNAGNILGNACQNVPNCKLDFRSNLETNLFELVLNNEKIAEGSFENKQLAKAALSNKALEYLKKKCFCIYRHTVFEEVTTGDDSKKIEETPASSKMASSKAFQMMLKMGWGGKGLGSKEQGEQKTVAETIVENITREGLGSKNVILEVENILKDFASSTKFTTLAFNSSFSKDERSQIHTIAAKYNLASKSIGKNEDRRITIKKKISRLDLVKELLRVNLENESYRLVIPENFIDLWREGV